MIPAVSEYAVDGVPLLRSAPVAGRTVATLTFRVGRFDEPLPAAGITHMVEHLTFAGRPRPSYTFNASVSGLYTTFVMDSADPADVADFVGAVCAGLTADASGQLDRERVVLRTEAASRGGAGALGQCLAERYGAAGPGVANYLEFALRHASWADVEAWRRRWFTAGNAVLTVAGEVPDGLRVSLPDGPAMRPRPVAPMDLALPGFAVAGGGGIGLSMVAPRSVAAAATNAILHERLTKVLRYENGLTYNVQSIGEALDDALAHSWIAADALAEQRAVVAHTMLTTFEELIDVGCDRAEIDAYASRLREMYADGPTAPLVLLMRRSTDLLTGRTTPAPEESLKLATELDPRAVRDTAQALYDQLIVATPTSIPAVQGRMGTLSAWSARSVSGRPRTSVDSDAALTMGDEGATLTIEPGRHEPAHCATVRYDSAVALVRWKNARQVLIGTDGFSIQLDADEWPDGERVLAEVAARVDPAIVVPLDTEGGPRPGRGKTAAEPDVQAQAATAGQAATRSRRRRWRLTRWGIRTFAVLLIAFGVTPAARSIGPLMVVAGTSLLLRFEYRLSKARRQARRRRAT